MSRNTNFFGILAALPFIYLGTACTVPNHMHVTEGISPHNIDTDVRFRTTYYFRVFDYCQDYPDIEILRAKENEKSNDGKAAGSQPATPDVSDPYGDHVPRTDTLYRYVMTGKAPSLSKVRFESGTLSASEIDPFGSSIAYDPDAKAFIRRTEAEARKDGQAVRDEREKEAKKARLLTEIANLKALSIKDTDAVKSQIATLEKEYATLVAGPPPAPQSDQGKLDTEKKSDPPSSTGQAAQGASGGGTNSTVPASGDQTTPTPTRTVAGCDASKTVKKGFQLIGPEGIVTYNQDSRLIMAMHTSADPLIQVLQDYSRRILQPNVNQSEQVLPFAEASLSAVTIQRDLARTNVVTQDPTQIQAMIEGIYTKAGAVP